MEDKKAKRRTNHVIIVTSDAVDANVRQFKIRTWVLGLIVIFLFAAFGALIGFLFYEERIWQAAIEKSNQQLKKMETLASEKDQVKAEMEQKELELTEEIQNLKDEVQILSTTLNQKVESEKNLTETIEALSIPTGFPLNGSATSIEAESGEKLGVKIETSANTMVVATAKGTVIAVNDDLDYGHNCWVDHGNGYVTIYRNNGTLAIKQGDEIYQGTTIFLTDESSTTIVYEMMQGGEYIDPLEHVDIKG